MENLYIKGSQDVFHVPSVKFDAQTGICEISGESYLEETVDFYEPLIYWLEDYIDETNGAITFNFKLSYFNTSSSRSILDILNLLKQYEENDGDVIVNWYLDLSDNDLKEEVEDFTIETDLKINLLPL